MLRNSEPGSAITHLVGMLLAIAGLVPLITVATGSGAAAVVSASVFGSALVLMYCASFLYHFFPKESRVKEVFRRLDHSFIYVLIAGTYTPVCLLLLPAGWGWSLFGVVWGLAVAGIVVKSVGVGIPDWVSTVLYIGLGWIVLVALFPMLDVMTAWGWFWLVLGGVLYTSGTLFYAKTHDWQWTKYFGAHEVWHLFVLAGSFSHFWFVMRFVL